MENGVGVRKVPTPCNATIFPGCAETLPKNITGWGERSNASRRAAAVAGTLPGSDILKKKTIYLILTDD